MNPRCSHGLLHHSLLGILIAPMFLGACTGGSQSHPVALKVEQKMLQPTRFSQSTFIQRQKWPEPDQLKQLPNHGTSKLVRSKIQNIKAAKAFLANYREQRPGQWHWAVRNVEGNPIYYHFYYTGRGTSIYIESDTRQAKFSLRQKVTREICDRLGSIKLDKGFVSWERCRKLS